MSYGTIFSIIGVIISAIFGIWGITLAIRNRYPGRITFVREQTIALFDSIGKNLPELSIEYKGKEIKKNLVLINGAFLNTGKIDISPSKTEMPITISLPEGFKWLTGKVISSSENVTSEIFLENENDLKLTPNLFRCGEFIRVQCLAEVPLDEAEENSDKKIGIGKKLEQAISFSHRIMDTGNIDQKKIFEEHVYSKRRRSSFVLLGFTVIFIVLLGSLLSIRGVPGSLVYSYKDTEGKLHDVTVHAKGNDKIKISSVSSEFSKISTVDDCFSNITGPPYIQPNKEIYKMFYIMGSTYIGLPLLLLLVIIVARRRNRKLMNILEI